MSHTPRYPESGKAFLSDLLSPVPPELSPAEVETVCRILLDMPDIGTWNQSALRILPRYRATAERLLIEDRQGDDREKSYRAQIWLAQLRGETPGATRQPSMARRRAAVSPAPDDSAVPPAIRQRLPRRRAPRRTAGPSPQPPTGRQPLPAAACFHPASLAPRSRSGCPAAIQRSHVRDPGVQRLRPAKRGIRFSQSAASENRARLRQESLGGAAGAGRKPDPTVDS